MTLMRTGTITSGEHGYGLTVWLTGLPSSGKTTLARLAARELGSAGVPTEVLDGDELRRTVCADLGFSREDRAEQARRAGEMSLSAARSGAVCLVALVSPFADARELVRERHRTAGVGFAEVHVSAAVSVCAARDVKGLYAAQRAGRLRGLTGVDAPYEAPIAPDLVVRTDAAPPAVCAASIVSVVTRRLDVVRQRAPMTDGRQTQSRIGEPCIDRATS